MYLILRVLNNSCVLVKDENNVEIIILHNGIGFARKPGDHIEKSDDYQIYSLENEDTRRIKELVTNTNPLFIEVAGEIISLAKQKLSGVDDKILVALADHIEFVVYRIENGIAITNPFSQDISILFEDEYAVALEAKKIIYERCGVEINEDEVAFITLHIHTALTKSSKVNNFIELTRIVNKYLGIMERDFEIKIDNNTVFYNRFLTHIKYMLVRIERNEELSVDISEFIRLKYEYAYSLAQKICIEISKNFNHPLNDAEISYLAIHIERIKNDEIERSKKQAR
ncbi:MAG: PRD domain-containing protein [Erysipelotrichaceae bacterium]|nr:PRD domain-containing protein [Erysipelotrichaceae bacterium]